MTWLQQNLIKFTPWDEIIKDFDDSQWLGWLFLSISISCIHFLFCVWLIRLNSSWAIMFSLSRLCLSLSHSARVFIVKLNIFRNFNFFWVGICFIFLFLYSNFTAVSLIFFTQSSVNPCAIKLCRLIQLSNKFFIHFFLVSLFYYYLPKSTVC